MARNAVTGVTMERRDARVWEFGRGDRLFSVEMVPDGPYQRTMAMPDAGGDPTLLAANEWAAGIVRAEMARTGTEVTFSMAAPTGGPPPRPSEQDDQGSGGSP